MKLRDRIDRIVVRCGLGTDAGRRATYGSARLIASHGARKGRHKWEDKGIAPGGLGSVFGDHLLVCKKCGRKIVYAAIDHNIFESINRQPCPGGKA